MRGFISSMVGGLIGVVALYAVGKVVYRAGYEMGTAECQYNAMIQQANSGPEAKEDKKIGFKSAVQRFGKKKSIIFDLVKHPDDHTVEASIEDDSLIIRVKPKSA